MLHAPDVPERSPADVFVAPPGDIFLDPELAVQKGVLDRIWDGSDCERVSQLARAALAAQRGNVATEMDFVERNQLEEAMGAKQDLVGMSAYEAERLSEQLLAHLPTGQYLIGAHGYVVAPGPWKRRWMSRMNADGTLSMFNRYDKTEPGVRATGTMQNIDLVKDVIRERIRWGVPLIRQPEEVAEPQLMATHPTNENGLPLVSSEMARTSLHFYSNHSDLLSGEKGILVQGNLRELANNPTDSAVAEHGTDTTVTLYFDAGAYIQDQKLRINDKGEYYDGPGDFTWQLISSENGARTIYTLRLAGSRVLPLPTLRLFPSGSLRSMHQPSVEELTNVWGVIRALLDSQQLEQRVARLRHARSQVAKPSVQQRTKEALQTLGRLDLYEEEPFRPEDPRKSKRGSSGGFKGNLVDVEGYVARENERLQTIAQLATTGLQLQLAFPH